MDKQCFIDSLKGKGITINQKEMEKFDQFSSFLIEENNKYNLTSITDYNSILEKHFYDSLSLLFSNDISGRVCDVGSGGGFPGVPLKIVSNKIDLYCLDSTEKRMRFIDSLANKLDIKVTTIVARAEESKEQFDYVIARGVASLNVLLELTCSLVKENGYLIAMKGSKYKEELDESKNAIEKLGYKLVDIYTYTLPSENIERANLKFQKIKKHDSKYPRNYSQIKNKPL